MIATAVDQAMREFEQHVSSPPPIQRAARLLENLVGRGLDTGMVQEIQARRLQDTLAYAYARSSFYRERFDRAGLCPADIRTREVLRRLPLTTPDDLHDWRRFLCVPPERLAAVFATAGTTGEPKQVYFTFDELRALTNFSAAALRISHSSRMVALIALPMSHGLWIGWNSAARIVERAGGLALPVGAGNPAETLRWMQRFEPNVAFSSPSYWTTLTREAERRDVHLALDKILVGGEQLSAKQRQRFEDYWGGQVFNSYGATEIGGGQTIRLPGCQGFHLNDLLLITEIVDPETGEPAEEGDLVFTTLRREAMPLIRYRIGDLARWTNCDCWLPFSAIQLRGRADDMLLVADTNLYAHVIAEAIACVAGTSGHIEIRLDKVDLIDRLLLRVAGAGVQADAVRQALFEAYPEIPESVQNGNLILDVETGAQLGNQIKAVRVRDERPQAGQA